MLVCQVQLRPWIPPCHGYICHLRFESDISFLSWFFILCMLFLSMNWRADALNQIKTTTWWHRVDSEASAACASSISSKATGGQGSETVDSDSVAPGSSSLAPAAAAESGVSKSPPVKTVTRSASTAATSPVKQLAAAADKTTTPSPSRRHRSCADAWGSSVQSLAKPCAEAAAGRGAPWNWMKFVRGLLTGVQGTEQVYKLDAGIQKCLHTEWKESEKVYIKGWKPWVKSLHISCESWKKVYTWGEKTWKKVYFLAKKSLHMRWENIEIVYTIY